MPSEMPQPVAWSDIAPEPMNPLLTRQFVSGTQAMLARIVLRKGCVVPRHSHPNEQIAYLESGLMRFSLGPEGAAEDVVLHPGEVLVIPADLPHLAEALEDSVDLDIFAPPRQDWISGNDTYLR